MEGVLNILTKIVAHPIFANYNRKNVCISFNYETRKEANIETVKVISNKDLIWCMRTEASNQCVFFKFRALVVRNVYVTFALISREV